MNYQNIQTGAIIAATDLNKITDNRGAWQQTEAEATHRVEVVVLPFGESVTFKSQEPVAAPVEVPEQPAAAVDFPEYPAEETSMPTEERAPELPVEEKASETIPGTDIPLADDMIVSGHEGEGQE